MNPDAPYMPCQFTSAEQHNESNPAKHCHEHRLAAAPAPAPTHDDVYSALRWIDGFTSVKQSSMDVAIQDRIAQIAGYRRG